MTAPEDQFRDAIRAAGLIPPDVIEPGRFHRFPGEGKRNGNTAGWCKLFADGMGGVFGDYSSGFTEQWQAKRERPSTAAERDRFREHVERARADAAVQQANERADARARASAIWEAAPPADGAHPYLVCKGVKAHGLRMHKGALVVPMRDADGTLHSLQFVGTDGTKRYLTDGRTAGCYFGIGKPGDRICIAEGYATGATIHEATGCAVAVAFDCGNLRAVAEAIRAKYPVATLILGADDDYRTDGNPGITKATEAARMVGGLLAIPDFGADRPEGATDFNDLATHRGREAVERAIATASAPQVSEPQPGADSAIAGDPDGLPDPLPVVAKVTSEPTSAGPTSRGERRSIAQVLIAIGSACELFHDERGDGHAITTDNDVYRTLRLRGRDFGRWLCKAYYDQTGKAANSQSLSAALGVLEAKATFDERQISLANRFVEQDGALLIDLCDARWRVVRVTPAGWEVLDRPPPLFRRYAHQKPLPEPDRGGTLSDLRRFMNLRDADEQHLVEAWLATAVFASIPRPALMLHGPQGAAKSTLARALKSLLDPSATDSIDLGRDPAGLAQVLDHNAVPCFDNLTGMPTWAGDLLCRGVTGGAFSKRELYSDAEDVLFVFRRSMILTGINIPTHAPDLLDRMILVELERIPPDLRQDERTFWDEFEAVRPRLFGALLDAIAGVLRYREQIRLDRLPRMADFAKLACAYAEYAGIGSDKMMGIIMGNAGRQIQEVIESDPLATAVRDFAETQRRWEGTATDLHAKLSQGFQNVLPEGWPKSAKTLGRRLKILHSTLADIGIVVTWGHSSDKRQRLICIAVGAVNQTSEMSVTSKAGPGMDSAPDVSRHADLANVRQTSVLGPERIKDLDVADVSDMSYGGFAEGAEATKIEVAI